MQDLDKILEKTVIFKALSSQELAQLAGYFQPFSCAAGTRIISQATSHRGLHVILSGSVQVRLKIFGGGELALAMLKEFDSFGEISLISDYAATASVIAVEEVQGLLLTPTSMQTIAIIYPQLSYKLKQAIALRCCQRSRKLLQHLPGNTHHQQIWSDSNQSKYKQGKQLNQFNTQGLNEFLSTSHAQSAPIPLLKILTKEELNILDELLQLRVLYRGDTVKNMDDHQRCFFGLLWGAIQAVLPGEHIVKVATYGPGKLFSTIEYVDCLERPYHYVVREEAVYFAINEETMTTIQDKAPKLWEKIMYVVWASIGAQMTNINWLFLQLNVEDVYKVGQEDHHV